MATKTNAKEIGTIGQMYEHRKTHQSGVLESRDEKFKTLMFRDKDGKSFTVTYSTFHSAWRKYAGEEPIQTSTQKEEEKSQKKEKADKAEKVIEETAKKPKLSQADKVKSVHALKDIIENAFAEKSVDIPLKITYSGGIKMRFNRHLIMEAWVRYAEEKYTFCTNEELAEKLKPLMPEYVEVQYHEKFQMQYKFRFMQDKVNEMLDIFCPVLREYIDEEKSKKKVNEEEEN